jgi:hypothetical protein
MSQSQALLPGVLVVIVHAPAVGDVIVAGELQVLFRAEPKADEHV